MSNADEDAPTSPPGGPRPARGHSGSTGAPGGRDPIWTVAELLQWTQQRFARAQIDEARTDAEHLLAAALGCDRLSLYVRHDEVVPRAVKASFREFVRRRLEREPVAYLLGKRGFHALDLELTVDSRVLVPRPDTEHLVDWLLEELAPEGGAPLRLLDVGTGSGAIALALKKARPDAEVTACDVSDDALAVARDNAEQAGLDIAFARSDLLCDLAAPDDGWHAIAANLPYIPSAELDALQPEVARWEPRLALDGGPDGLGPIRRFVAQVPAVLAPGGRIYLELGHGQSTAVQGLLRDAGFTEISARRDYGGIERVVRGFREDDARV